MKNEPAPTTPPTPKTKNNKLWIALAAGVLALIALIILGLWGSEQNSSAKKANKELSSLKDENKKLAEELEKRKTTTGQENIDESAYQAVFLKSGQVYFGKITKLTETQLTLENIYYLSTKSAGSKVDLNNLAPNVTLVKLGNELHGPQDAMYIERKEVEFWENLKADSQVSQAIRDNEKAN